MRIKFPTEAHIIAIILKRNLIQITFRKIKNKNKMIDCNMTSLERIDQIYIMLSATDVRESPEHDASLTCAALRV